MGLRQGSVWKEGGPFLATSPISFERFPERLKTAWFDRSKQTLNQKLQVGV